MLPHSKVWYCLMWMGQQVVMHADISLAGCQKQMLYQTTSCHPHLEGPLIWQPLWPAQVQCRRRCRQTKQPAIQSCMLEDDLHWKRVFWALVINNPERLDIFLTPQLAHVLGRLRVSKPGSIKTLLETLVICLAPNIPSRGGKECPNWCTSKEVLKDKSGC